MSSMNQVTLIGNLGADPEVRSFQNGGQVANLRIATTESWKDRDGNRQERTEWHTVAVFSDGLVRVIQNYLRKGSKVMVQGKLQTRKWQDRDGNDRYSTEVVLQGFDAKLAMLDPPRGGGQQGGGGQRRGDSGGGDWGNDNRGGGNQRGGGGGGNDWGRDGRGDSGGNDWGGGGGGSNYDDLDDDIPF